MIEDVRVLPPTGIKPVVERLRELGLEGGKIGIVGGVRGQMNLPLEHLEALTAAFLSMELPRSHNIVDQRRAIKSEEEIAWLREGCRMTDSCFAAVRDHARPGLLDYELRAIILEAILDEGGMTHIEFCAATPMCAPRLPFPLMHKSERALAKGDIILTEISAGFYGYAGQQQRPFAVGEPPTAEYRAVFDFAAHLFDEVCADPTPRLHNRRNLADLRQDVGQWLHQFRAAPSWLGAWAWTFRSSEPMAPSGNSISCSKRT